jgi:hypothetical protein
MSIQPMLMRRRDNASMLSPATLAAFSAGAAQSGFGPANPVHRVRSVAAQPAQPATPAPLTPPVRDGEATPGRTLPRGSLLDLSV